MRVLVTGGAGFIGSHVVDRLIAHGVVPVIFDMGQSDYHPAVEHVIGSILDVEALRVAMSKVQAVIHLAAVADVKDVYEDPFYAESVNVRGTACVLEAARRCKGKRIIYGSTTWVYSDVPQQEMDEETPLAPPSHLYTATKIASEYYCQSYAKLYGIEYTILRFGIPYGPRARDGAVIPIFVNKALRGEPLTIAGDGSQFRKFVYVEDLAEGNVLALAAVAKNKIYNLDGAEQVTIKQIAETIQKILGDVRIEYTPSRPGDFSGKRVLSARARQELSWEPTTSFEEGVRRYIQWVKQRKDQRDVEEARLDPALR